MTYDLRCLCQRNKDGSHATQAERLTNLTMISKQLKSAGFKRMNASSLKPKHVIYLVEQWQAQNLSIGTIKNRMTHLRWWAEKVGKSSVIPKDNIQLGIEHRQYVTPENKAKHIADDALTQITDSYVRMSLILQQTFGLRREECIKFQPAYADKGDHLLLKGSWTKGGRQRIVPILTQHQRDILNQIHHFAGKGSLIPANKSYIQQRNTYDGQCQKVGLNKMHGLRHAYAQTRYETLTGWKSPKAGGLTSKELTPEQQIKDQWARQVISRELGHERIEVVAVYLGG
ncbi:integrase domain-containing protein [Utexia brackfieldae]